MVLLQTKSIKIIKDRDDRPKGFGYIEFATLDGLKDALARSGQSFASRTVRVSVAEPRKSGADSLAELEAQSAHVIQLRNAPVDSEVSTMIPSSPGRGGEKDHSQI
jgi:RNA recognition motif-containing protein